MLNTSLIYQVVLEKKVDFSDLAMFSNSGHV